MILYDSKATETCGERTPIPGTHAEVPCEEPAVLFYVIRRKDSIWSKYALLRCSKHPLDNHKIPHLEQLSREEFDSLRLTWLLMNE